MWDAVDYIIFKNLVVIRSVVKDNTKKFGAFLTSEKQITDKVNKYYKKL